MDLLFQKIVEQLILVSVSVSIAIILGVPLGILAKYSSKLQTAALGTANVFQTIPSLALLAALLPVFGIGMTPAIIALTLYAFLPILRNTVMAFDQIPKDYIEAAKSLGANKMQCLWKIELPLAMPLIIAGIRIAVAMTMGIATIAAFIGAGGLGDFITRGLAMNNHDLLLLGAVPSALLALTLDGLFAHFQRKPKYVCCAIFLILFVLIFWTFYPKNSPAEIRIGTKNLTEQYILGEILSQLIEAKTTLKVERKFNLGTTEICHEALLKGEIDLYPEYTGTAYMTVLQQDHPDNPEQLFAFVKDQYARRYHILWLSPFGFNNAQSLTVRSDFARQYHLKNISDLAVSAPQFTLGAPPEFLDRRDAYPALQKKYHLNFKKIHAMDASLMYPAIMKNEVDVINAFTTDGRIPVYHLSILQDDKQAFPSYEAAPLIREDVLKAHPELLPILEKLSGQISTPEMEALNKEVDIDKHSPAEAAHHFLLKKHLLD
jgi:osmoprotectant transport system permease protein